MDGNFVKPREWTSWFNTEARALDTFMLRAGYTGQQPQAAANTPGDYTGISTGDALVVIGAYELKDGRYRKLKYTSPVDFFRYDLLGDTQPTGTAARYSVLRQDDSYSVKLDPLPTSGTYVVLYYSSNSVSLDDTTDTLPNQPYIWTFGAEERIVLGMAKRALVKENSDTSQIDDLILAEERRLEELIWSMNFSDGARVRNVDRDDRGWSDSPHLGTWESWIWL